MGKNYKKLIFELDEKLDVHYIDWNKKNDDINNLMIIPYKIRELVHEYLGYVNREELEILVDKFESNINYRKKSLAYLNSKLSQYVNLNKGCELSSYCFDNLGKIRKRRKGGNNTNYRKMCSEEYGEIPKGWEVHHIDWNHHNNEIINLIAIPKPLHDLIHKMLGYVNREEIEVLLKEYRGHYFPEDGTLEYAYHKLSGFVNTNKTCELSSHCNGRMEYERITFLNAFNWRDGNIGMI